MPWLLFGSKVYNTDHWEEIFCGEHQGKHYVRARNAQAPHSIVYLLDGSEVQCAETYQKLIDAVDAKVIFP
jgi:hypothetical protein